MSSRIATSRPHVGEINLLQKRVCEIPRLLDALSSEIACVNDSFYHMLDLLSPVMSEIQEKGYVSYTAITPQTQVGLKLDEMRDRLVGLRRSIEENCQRLEI